MVTEPVAIQFLTMSLLSAGYLGPSPSVNPPPSLRKATSALPPPAEYAPRSTPCAPRQPRFPARHLIHPRQLLRKNPFAAHPRAEVRIVQLAPAHRPDPIEHFIFARGEMPLQPVRKDILHRVGQAQRGEIGKLRSRLDRLGDDLRQLMIVQPNNAASAAASAPAAGNNPSPRSSPAPAASTSTIPAPPAAIPPRSPSPRSSSRNPAPPKTPDTRASAASFAHWARRA